MCMNKLVYIYAQYFYVMWLWQQYQSKETKLGDTGWTCITYSMAMWDEKNFSGFKAAETGAWMSADP